jgi:hypothetical protein
MAAPRREKAEKMLYLDYFDGRMTIPGDFVCPQQNDYLTIDEDCTVLTCCAIEKNAPGYAIGNLFELSAADIREKKQSRPVCRECMKHGIPYIYDHLPSPYER